MLQKHKHLMFQDKMYKRIYWSVKNDSKFNIYKFIEKIN